MKETQALNSSQAGVSSPVRVAVLMPHAPILVPAVGGARGRDADATVGAMRAAAARVVSAAPESVVLVSPHSPRHPTAFGIWRGGWLRGSLDQFGAPEAGVNLQNDLQLASAIATEARVAGVETWDITRGPLDHGALVPLWYLTDAGWHGPTVVLSLNHPQAGGLVELGRVIAAASVTLGRRIAIVASGDMSHRLKPGAPAGYDPRAKRFDRAFIETVGRGAYHNLLRLDPGLQELAAEDAVDSTVIAASAVGWSAAGHEVLSYEGPFGVGYGVAVLFDGNGRPTASCGGWGGLPRVARASVAAVLNGREAQPPQATDDVLRQRHGVFVTIRGREGELRGCVGTLSPQFPNVIAETWQMARDAAFRDGRFPPVRPEELPSLSFEVSVLQPLEEAASETELDPRRYGVVVGTEDGRRGALLPSIPEIRTVTQQLAIARRKGGIEPGEPVRLQRFTVTKIKDPDLAGQEN